MEIRSFGRQSSTDMVFGDPIHQLRWVRVEIGGSSITEPILVRQQKNSSSSFAIGPIDRCTVISGAGAENSETQQSFPSSGNFDPSSSTVSICGRWNFSRYSSKILSALVLLSFPQFTQ
nr:hypothetical protein Iba_chr05dCG11400 [Ipomoea batatas]